MTPDPDPAAPQTTASRRRGQPVGDFASAAMLRVLAQGMRERGWRPDPDVPAVPGREATVALADKRRLVGSAIAHGGLASLALLGQGLHRLAHEPTHRALATARDAGDLLSRWARLERYIHSRHRIQVQSLGAGEACVRHVARPGNSAPMAAEDLVVLGVLAALLQALGAREVQARAGEAPVFPEPDAAALDRAVRAGHTGDWRLTWAAGTDRMPTVVAAPAGLPPEAWGEEARQCYRLMSADLMRPLPLPELARALGRAPRTLQRLLAQAGLSVTQVLAEARCRTAAAWLLDTRVPVAEIGFVCGYADQPHFTRDFRQRVGMTPGRYRADFAAPLA